MSFLSERKEDHCCREVEARVRKQVNLQSDVEGVAKVTDSHIVNPWGLARAGKKLWIANNGTGTVFAINDKGKRVSDFIRVPGLSGAGNPTGIVANKGDDFKFTINATTVPAKLILSTEEGLIQVYNPLVDPINFITLVNNNATAIYKGLGLSKHYLYAANFFSGFVERYDGNFAFVNSFMDPALLASGYGPFNIKVVGCHVYVAFAKQDEAKEDEVKGQGFGYIDVFSRDGILEKRLINRGPLNAPWGLEIIHDKYLLVGNFGDGTINIFRVCNGEFLTTLKDCHGNIVSIDGLWGIDLSRCHNDLFFAAGIDDEVHGLVGKLQGLHVS